MKNTKENVTLIKLPPSHSPPQHSNDNQATEPQLEAKQDAYLQINQASFQENFKVLIGHYQSDGHESRVA